jgi:ribosome-binding factor A
MRHKPRAQHTPNRQHRVADQIQRDLAELIRDLSDPRIGMVTLNLVEVSPDYAHAKVFFSVLGGEPAESEAALNAAAGFLRNGLFKRLSIHTVPSLHFRFDRTTERAADLSALIARANATRAKE